MGGNPTSGTEENLLGYPGTKYYGENIFMHEFSHAILGGGIRTADPKLYEEVSRRVQERYGKRTLEGPLCRDERARVLG